MILNILLTYSVYAKLAACSACIAIGVWASFIRTVHDRLQIYHELAHEHLSFVPVVPLVQIHRILLICSTSDAQIPQIMQERGEVHNACVTFTPGSEHLAEIDDVRGGLYGSGPSASARNGMAVTDPGSAVKSWTASLNSRMPEVVADHIARLRSQPPRRALWQCQRKVTTPC